MRVQIGSRHRLTDRCEGILREVCKTVVYLRRVARLKSISAEVFGGRGKIWNILRNAGAAIDASSAREVRTHRGTSIIRKYPLV